MTDDYLDPLFANYYQRLGIPQQTFKRDYHGLAAAIPIDEIPKKVIEILNIISKVAGRATPEE